MKTRLHIDRLVLKTNGLTPAAAEAAARAIAPALAARLSRPGATSAALPAVTVTLPASAATPAQIAGHVARQLSNAPRP